MHFIRQVHFNGGIQMNAAERIAFKGGGATNFRRKQRTTHESPALHAFEITILRPSQLIGQCLPNRVVHLVKQHVRQLRELRIRVR